MIEALTFFPEEDQSQSQGPLSLMLLLRLSHGCEISNVRVEILAGRQLSKARGHTFGRHDEEDAKPKVKSYSYV